MTDSSIYDHSISVEDRLEIQELYARYAWYADASDGENWAACFAREGRFVPSITDSAGKLFEGRKALSDFIADPAHRPRTARHWNTALCLERHKEHIIGRCYAFLLDASRKSEPNISASVTYLDTIIHEDGAWRFKERRPTRDGE